MGDHALPPPALAGLTWTIYSPSYTLLVGYCMVFQYRVPHFVLIVRDDMVFPSPHHQGAFLERRLSLGITTETLTNDDPPPLAHQQSEPEIIYTQRPVLFHFRIIYSTFSVSLGQSNVLERLNHRLRQLPN